MAQHIREVEKYLRGRGFRVIRPPKPKKRKMCVADQKLKLADLIKKGRSMLSERELVDFVPHVLLQLFDWRHAKQKLFIYYFGFALVAKLGGVKSAKKYLLRLLSEKRLLPYKTLGISRHFAQVLFKEFTPPHRYKGDFSAWLRATAKKARVKSS